MLRLVCSWWVLDLYLLWSASQTVVSTQEQSCGILGNDYRQPYHRDTSERFFLNTQNPADCNGTIDEFQYCYYKSDSEDDDSYGFTFAVYRETSSGTYINVSEAFSPARSPNSSVSFLCLRFPLVNSIEVQAGDMIGACVYDPPDPEGSSRRETYVVGDQAGDRFLMRIDTNECGDFEVPNDVNSLSRTNSHVLHVSAIILAFAITEPLTESSTNTLGATMSTTQSSTNTVGDTMSTTVPTDPSEPVSSNGGSIAAVVVTVLIVVVVSAAVLIVVVVVLTHKWKQSKDSYQVSNSIYNTEDIALESNEAYHVPNDGMGPASNVPCPLPESEAGELEREIGMARNEAYTVTASQFSEENLMKKSDMGDLEREFGMARNEAYTVTASQFSEHNSVKKNIKSTDVYDYVDLHQ